MNGDDKRIINNLEAVSSGSTSRATPQHRDASGNGSGVAGSSGSSGSRWRGKPTPIQTPSNSRQSHRMHASDPYTKVRDNLSAPKASSSTYNPSAKQNLANYTVSTHRKKVKLGPDSPPTRNRKPQIKVNPMANRKPEVVTICDSDEDTGQSIDRPQLTSSDPILIDGIPSPSLDAPRRPTQGSTSTSRLQISALQNRQSVEVDDDIEDFEKPTHLEKPTLLDLPIAPPGNVRQKRKMFEGNGQPRPGQVLHVDFRHPPSNTKSVKAGMKPKGERNSLFSPMDAVATSSTKYTSKKSTASKAKSSVGVTNIAMPIEAWFHGVCILPEPNMDNSPKYTMTWTRVDRNESKISITPNSTTSLPSPEFLSRCIHTFTSSEDSDNPLFTFRFHKDVKAPKLKSTSHFTPGSMGRDGFIVLKFCTKHDSFKESEYRYIITQLQSELEGKETVNAHGARSCWAMMQDALLLKEMANKRNGSSNSSVTDGNLAQRRVQQAQAARDGSNAKSGKRKREPSLVRTVSPPPPKKPRPRPRPKRPSDETSTDQDQDPSPVPRRSARHSAEHIASSSRRSPVGDSDELILVYPPVGTGAINITRAEINRLEPNEFLNDTLIEFGLKLWLNDLREKDPEFADQVHVFSSFFYKKLNKKPYEEGFQSVRKWTSKFDLFKKKYLIVPINEHLHWYLAIIYQPEHCLNAPPPRENVSTVSTRTRARQSDAAQNNDAPPPSTHSGSPPRDNLDENGSNYTVASEQGEDEVEQLLEFKASCSISDDEKRDSSASASRKESAVEPIEVDDDDGRSGAPSAADAAIGSADDSMAVELSCDDIATRSARHSPTLSQPGLADDSPAVPPRKFYGPAANKGKGKAKPRRSPLDLEEDVDPMDCIDVSMDEPKPEEPQRTWIFTLDSLGSRHPQAVKILANYLKMEARDKKHIEETTDAVGKQANVPTQPNFCDCGVYLLHFAKTFMENPEHFARLIITSKKSSARHTDRQSEWNDNAIKDVREVLIARIQKMSKEWQVIRDLKKKEEEKEEKAKESSDDEVVIEEGVVLQRDSPKGKRKSGGGEVAAARMRG
ncbi:hypothetical protein PLICRDRAFT_273907 [Plicaturopsis crispa FD-325 SS-3]|nr:hypothetical protein PLICRDRAFT_273907 [Plicaturopsis crispa FD-325 SS-3]